MSNDRSKSGFLRALARELLVHNSQVNDIDTALKIADEFVQKTSWSDSTHTRRAKGYGTMD